MIKKAKILKLRKVFVFCFVVILIIFAGYIVISKLGQENKDNWEILDKDSELVKELYNSVNPSNDATVLKSLYENSQITNDYIIVLGISEYLKSQQDYPNTISSFDVEKSIYHILGENIQFDHQTVLLLNGSACGYSYESDSKEYIFSSGCGGNSREFFHRIVVEAKQWKDEIQIIEKSIYEFNDWDDKISRIHIYDNYHQNNLLDYMEKDSSISYTINIEDYIEKASSYVYSFKKKDDHYIFVNFKKMEQ